jgi:hypothetical protein
MMNHIAVVLRGHIRTWEYTRPAIFDFYDSIAKNVDYYFVTWNYEGAHRKTIEDAFIGRNLIKLLYVHIGENEHYDNWKGPAWLNYNILPYKHQREKEVTYDAVFDTRPDIIYNITNSEIVLPPEDDVFYCTGYTNQPCPDTGKMFLGIQDCFFMSTSKVHDIMSERFIQWNDIGCHSKLVQVASDNNITTAQIKWLQESIVRPNSFELIPDPFDYFKYRKTGYGLRQIEQGWMNLSSDEKIRILQKYNIKEMDYRTVSIGAKI